MCQLFPYAERVTRWLEPEQQRAWRAYVRMQGELNAHLSRQMSVDSEISMADFAVLVQLTDAGEHLLHELSRHHRAELRAAGPHLTRALERVTQRARGGAESEHMKESA